MPGVVDEDVQSAQRALNVVEDRIHRSDVGDVRQRAPYAVFHPQCVEMLLRDVTDVHPRAIGRELARDLRSNAGSAACNESAKVFQRSVVHAKVLRCADARKRYPDQRAT